MNANVFYLSLVFGLCFSILLEEVLGISAGGMIVPAYLSLICNSIKSVILVIAAALLIFVIINHVLPHFIVLFGKRKYVATLLVGLVIKLLLEVVFPMLPWTNFALSGLGIITPALIANACGKQGIRYTIPAVVATAYLTYGCVLLVSLFI